MLDRLLSKVITFLLLLIAEITKTFLLLLVPKIKVCPTLKILESFTIISLPRAETIVSSGPTNCLG